LTIIQRGLPSPPSQKNTLSLKEPGLTTSYFLMASTPPKNGLSNGHGHTPNRANDSVASSSSEMIELLNLYEHFARQDGEKDAFVQVSGQSLSKRLD
jgi:hypothetical protein